MDDLDRIRAEYEQRDSAPGAVYSSYRAPNFFALQSRERALRDGLEANGLLPLFNASLLEVGVGGAAWFPTFHRFGLAEERFAGIDLMADRVEKARVRTPKADMRVGDGASLPWDDGSFDVVFQGTMLSSVLDDGLQARIAAEMLRVVRPTGAIVSYDFSFNNPRNKQVRGVHRRDLKRLFPNCVITTSKASLAPPVARRLVPISWTLAELLQGVRVANTHLLAVVRPMA